MRAISVLWDDFQSKKDDLGLMSPSMGQRKSSKSQIRNWTSDLQILHSVALPLSHRDSVVSEAISTCMFICDTHSTECHDKQCQMHQMCK